MGRASSEAQGRDVTRPAPFRTTVILTPKSRDSMAFEADRS